MEKKNILSILIVDDDGLYRAILGNYLDSLNKYNVEICESGEGALKLLTSTIYDVVILDYFMTGISGLNVMQWINEQKLDTPVIMLTGAGSENIAVEVMKLGAYDYIKKDQLDLEHLPILIDGTYERYIFKKEKEHIETLKRDSGRHLQNIHEFQDSLSLMELTIKNLLAVVTLEIDDLELNLSIPERQAETKQIIDQVRGLKEQCEILTTTLLTLFEISGNISKSCNNLKSTIIHENSNSSY